MRTRKVKGNSTRHFGEIYVFLMLLGLVSTAFTHLADADIWTIATEIPTPRFSLSASVVSGQIYVIGGWPDLRNGPVLPLSTVEKYTPETGIWSQRTSIPTERADFATSVVNGKIYAVGGLRIRMEQGRRKARLVSAVEIYDPATDRWTKSADIPTPRDRLATSAVDGKIYAIGGWKSVPLSIVEAYDPLTDTWTRKADMLTSRMGLSTCVVDGKIYAIGGVSEFGPLGVVKVYDPRTDHWTRKTDMLTPRMHFAAGVVNNRIYATGGTPDLNTTVSVVEMYNPSIDTWAKQANLQTPRSGLSICAMNDRLYAIGGISATPVVAPPIATVEVYTPDIFAVSSQDKLATTWGEIRRGP